MIFKTINMLKEFRMQTEGTTNPVLKSQYWQIFQLVMGISKGQSLPNWKRFGSTCPILMQNSNL